METNRLVNVLHRLAIVILIVTASACQPADTEDEAESLAAASETIPMNGGAPTLAELAKITYMGITGEPVTLTNGQWYGEPFVAGGASRPGVGLVRDFHLTGDLNGNGAEEAVVLLWSNSGGSGTFDYIAVAGRDKNGAPLNLATAALGDRVKIRSAEINDGRITVNVVQAGPEDAACCPGQKFKRTFTLADDELNEVSSEDQGRQSIADLAGIEWTLTSFNRDDALPENIEVTLVFDGNRIAGKSACNRYSGSVTEGGMPGALTVNMPMIGTMMACPPPADEIERRYLATLHDVTQYSFLAGNLALSWRKDEQLGTIIFSPHELPK
jgi:heat shock protein HslJ